VSALKSRNLQRVVGGAGVVLLVGFLIIHVFRDLSGDAEAWYFRSTWVWLLVMSLGSAVYLVRRAGLIRSGVDWSARFSTLPD
jgi:APA family basic amino acid/polyamine antiporter